MPSHEQLPIIALGYRREAEGWRDRAEGEACQDIAFLAETSLGRSPTNYRRRLTWPQISEARGQRTREAFAKMTEYVRKAERLERLFAPDAFPTLLGTSAPSYGIAPT